MDITASIKLPLPIFVRGIDFPEFCKKLIEIISVEGKND